MAKLFLLTLITAAIGYYILHNQKEHSVTDLTGWDVEKNTTNNISYSKRISGGTLNLNAEKVNLRSKDQLILSGITANFIKSPKETLVIKSNECVLDLKERIANLNGNVTIEASDIVGHTSNAVLDFKSGSIYGRSKVIGEKGNDKFTADGFELNQTGVVKLKKARFARGR